ncbi:ANK1 [Symbiodinium sp. CCMP2592]|nr:ANK1 [Symbiodinium sp. CCMP2592]
MPATASQVLEETRSHEQTAEWLRRLPKGELRALIRLATEELSRRDRSQRLAVLLLEVCRMESVTLSDTVDLLATGLSEVTAPRGGPEGEEETWPREGEEETSENLPTTPGGSLLRRSRDRMRFSLDGAPTLLGDEERSRLLAELRGSSWRAEVPLSRAPPRLRSDREVLLAAAREDPATLRFAADLQKDRNFWLWIVRQTKAWWLIHFGASQKLLEDPSFLEGCKKAAGTGLVFTYYDDHNLFQTLRRKLPTAGASVPGGDAYDLVMEEVSQNGSTATVWFGDEPVFGHNADRGEWLHPSSECGRDDIPVPPANVQDAKWRSTVDSRTRTQEPIVGKRYKCWCCRWLREVQRHHAQGEVICCAVSNIYNSDWVELYGAGSSELSDVDAGAHGLPKSLGWENRI